MARMGSLLTSGSPLPSAEYLTGGSWSNVIANNSQFMFEFGRFTLPWPGEVMATFYCSASFSGFQQLQLNPVTCTPAPDWYPALFSTSQASPTDFHTVITWAHWPSLVAGTTIIGTATVQVGNGGPAVTGDHYAVSFRAVRS